MSFDFINQRTGYTGPLQVAAYYGTDEQEQQGSGHRAIILIGNAKDCSHEDKVVRVRMEMTPEEAFDLAKSILSLATPALEKKK